MFQAGDGLHDIGREIRSSRGRFRLLGSRRPVGSPVPASMSRWLIDSIGAGSGSNAVGIVGACRMSPRGCGSPTIRPDAASTRPSWPDCWLWRREPGCKLAVSVLDLPGPETGPRRRPLYGPIPWSWWLPASRLPGKVPPSRFGLLVACRLEAIGRFRAGVGCMGGSRPLSVLGLPGPGQVGTGQAGLRRPDARPVSDRYYPGCWAGSDRP